jgi:Flp pilus assembly protein CpaB
MDEPLYRAALPGDMLESLVGRQVGEPIHAEQVLARAQVAERSGLASDLVAITIPARPESAVGGRLRPGDNVQVLVTVADKTRSEAHTRLVLERAQVFKVGREQSLSSSSSSAEGEGRSRTSISSVTLAVTAEQARQLAEARRSGELDVLLLPPPAVPHP